MAIFYLPLINPDDYDAFRRILHGNLPDTYDEWGNLHVKEAADIKGRGHEYLEVKIYPDEFARHCNARGAHRELHALKNFAFEKATAQEK